MRDFLDAGGPLAWALAIIAVFMVATPLGFVLLVYRLVAGRRLPKRIPAYVTRAGHEMGHTTGNFAFDAYRQETLKRLEDEQRAFEAFLEKLREAKDKAEFDQFMAERRAE